MSATTTYHDLKSAIADLLAIISKLEDTEMTPQQVEEAIVVVTECADTIDAFLFDLED